MRRLGTSGTLGGSGRSSNRHRRGHRRSSGGERRGGAVAAAADGRAAAGRGRAGVQDAARAADPRPCRRPRIWGCRSCPRSPSRRNGPGGFSSDGPKSISIWYRDPQHVRVAEMVQAGETDLRLNGRTLWVWNSKTADRDPLYAARPISPAFPPLRGTGWFRRARHSGFPAPRATPFRTRRRRPPRRC